MSVPFTQKSVDSLIVEHLVELGKVDALVLAFVRAGSAAPPGAAREYMTHGVGRRLRTLHHALRSIFSDFPPAQSQPLENDALHDVESALHTFVINLYGLFENLAWAFVHRHNLEASIGNRKSIGLFLKKTQQYLPAPLRAYLTLPKTVQWHDDYLKNYRDALAHRIPMYIPPFLLSPQQADEHADLWVAEGKAIESHQWERLDEVREEAAGMRRACHFFVHSIVGSDQARPVYLHPQLLCDIKTVTEFCPLFLANWHSRA